MNVLKRAVKEQASAKRLDQDMFIELNMILFSMRESDQTFSIENKDNLSKLFI